MSTEQPHFVGIDPGKEGFQAEITASGEVIDTWEQPLTSDAKGDTFDLTAMVRIARGWKKRGVELVVIELTQPQGGARSSAQRGFMQAAPYFLWRGVLAALEIRTLLVKDTIWKKGVGVTKTAREKKEEEPIKPKRDDYPNGKAGGQRYLLDTGRYKEELKVWKRRDGQRRTRNTKQSKNASTQTCQNFFPGLDLRRNTNCKVPHDGKAEALLIAVYASRVGSPVAAS